MCVCECWDAHLPTIPPEPAGLLNPHCEGTQKTLTLAVYVQVFGYPTGLGALLIHKEAARHLRKVYFGGGSVDYCTAEDAWAVMSAPPAGLEDGTLGFLNIAALKHGFVMLDRLGGMKVCRLVW